MAIKIDNSLLVELGLGDLPAGDKTKLLQTIYETLETRVGIHLAGEMSDQQLTEFEQIIDTNNEQAAVEWLEKNYPNYADVVAEELAKLKAEIKKDAAKIRSSVKPDSNPTQNRPAK